MYGMHPSAVSPTSARSGSTSTGTQPSTSRPSSAAMDSTRCTADPRSRMPCGRKQTPAAKVFSPSPLADGNSNDDNESRSSTGSWIRMPAPSPLLGSAPAAPRCSRFSSARTPSDTIECERRPAMSAIIATPQESFSALGSYSPCSAGIRENNTTITST